MMAVGKDKKKRKGNIGKEKKRERKRAIAIRRNIKLDKSELFN